jgi:thiol-disulfide isomerase/thioredoxin
LLYFSVGRSFAAEWPIVVLIGLVVLDRPELAIFGLVVFLTQVPARSRRCCGRQKMAPAFEQAAAELEPRVRLANLNTDEAQSIAARFNIRSIPTLAIFDHGREIARQAGAMNREQLMRWVQANAG